MNSAWIPSRTVKGDSEESVAMQGWHYRGQRDCRKSQNSSASPSLPRWGIPATLKATGALSSGNPKFISFPETLNPSDCLWLEYLSVTRQHLGMVSFLILLASWEGNVALAQIKSFFFF